MSLIEKVRKAVLSEGLPPIFSAIDIDNIGIKDPNNNISNYDKKNKGSTNVKVLVSRKIDSKIYYSFDEMLFK
jgi:hypothetical protein